MENHLYEDKEVSSVSKYRQRQIQKTHAVCSEGKE